MWVERSISAYSVASQWLENVLSIPVVCVRTSAFENLEAKDSSSPSSFFFNDARRRRYGDVCICIADSLCYTAETNTPL